MKRHLTEQERTFALGYLHEQLYGEGPAFKWVEESGVAHGEVQPFTLYFSKGRGVNQPLPPEAGGVSGSLDIGGGVSQAVDRVEGGFA